MHVCSYGTSGCACTGVHAHPLMLSSSPVYQVEMICLALLCICMENSAHVN